MTAPLDDAKIAALVERMLALVDMRRGDTFYFGHAQLAIAEAAAALTALQAERDALGAQVIELRGAVTDAESAARQYHAEMETARDERDEALRQRDEAVALAVLLTQGDHSRGCEGRMYNCTCQYDDQVYDCARATLAKIGGAA